jgi:TorA maturation chaperone TorD
MHDQDFARALSNTYSLLSRLVLEGITPDVEPFIEAIPSLSEALNSDARTPDDHAADHTRVFDLEVFPYESIFLGTDNLIGAESGDAVLSFYARAGYSPDDSAPSPDHLAIELDFLAWVCGAEAEAWEDSASAAAHRMRSIERAFLDEHLLRWLVPFSEAVRQQEQPFYRAVASLIVQTAAEHRAVLGDELLNPPAPFSLPTLPDLLEDETTGLKDIGRFLLTPAYSGVYLSRSDIERLARRRDLPRGFGPRDQMLNNLLHAAARFDALDALLADLLALLDRWDLAYAAWEESAPSLRPFLAPWRARLTTTRALLHEMLDRVQTISPEPGSKQ